MVAPPCRIALTRARIAVQRMGFVTARWLDGQQLRAPPSCVVVRKSRRVMTDIPFKDVSQLKDEERRRVERLDAPTVNSP